MTKYVYYHCTRSVNYDCDEPYITEEDLIIQLLGHINAGNVKIDKSKTAKKLKAEIERFHRQRSEVLHQEYLSGNLGEIKNEAVKVTMTKWQLTSVGLCWNFINQQGETEQVYKKQS